MRHHPEGQFLAQAKSPKFAAMQHVGGLAESVIRRVTNATKDGVIRFASPLHTRYRVGV